MSHYQYPIARYLNVQMAYSPAFTADGENIVFIADITGIPQVWRTKIPAAGSELYWPDQLTFEADRVQAVMTSPISGDNRIIYARDKGGNENAQLFLVNSDDGSEICLTEGHDDALHIPGPWSNDGAFIIFAANRRNPGLFDLYKQPLDGDAQLIYQNENAGFLVNMQIAPNGNAVTAMHMKGSFDTRLLEVDLVSGDIRQVTPDTSGVRYYDIRYTPDGKTLFCTTDYQTDFMHLASIDLATLAIDTVYAPEWNVETVEIAPDGRHVLCSVNEDGDSKLILRNLETGVSRVLPGYVTESKVITSIFHFSADSKRITGSFNTATRTSDVYIWDLESGQSYPVTRGSHGGIPTESFTAPELVHYPTFDEDDSGNARMIPAWYFRPKDTSNTPLPVVVYVHGGPEGQSRPNFSFLMQYLLHNGYAVFVPNVRGSTGYGKAYSHLDDVEKRMDSVADLAHGAQWLKKQPGIDGDRLVVYGGSYGGFMVLSALTTYPDLWVAAVDIVGISNFVTFLKNTSDYRRAHRESEYGSLEKDREFLESISPANQVDNITAPLMIIHGANDPRVPLSEAEQMVAALESRDVPVEFLVFDDEGHGIVKRKNKLVMYPAVIDFLNKYV